MLSFLLMLPGPPVYQMILNIIFRGVQDIDVRVLFGAKD